MTNLTRGSSGGGFWRGLFALGLMVWIPSFLLAAATAGSDPELTALPMAAASVMVVAVVVCAIAAAKLERVRQGIWISMGIGVAATVVIIALVAYLPCARSSGDWVALPSWILRVFFGDYETDGKGQVCGTRFSPALDAARTLGVTLTVAGAISVVFVLARRQFGRLSVRLHADLDVVAGLDGDSLALIEALVAQAAARPWREPWVDYRPGFLGGAGASATSAPHRLVWLMTGLRKGDLRRLFNRRTKVVAIDPDPGNPYIAEVERLGAMVIRGDAADPQIMKLVATRGRRTGRRVTVRRLFAVSPNEGQNLKVWEALRTVLNEGHPAPHVDDVVPRVVVRMNDAREARLWRVSQMQNVATDSMTGSRAPALVSDAFSMDALAAEVLSRLILPDDQWLHSQQTVSQVLLVGEGSLAISVLEELSWRQWCRFEVALEFGKADTEAQPRLARVVLAGPKAGQRVQEWQRLRAPWRFPGAQEKRMRVVDVTAESGDPEDLAADILTRDPDAMVVFLNHSDDDAAAATRLARRFPGSDHVSRVVMRGQEQTESVEQIIVGGLLTFAPTLVTRTPMGLQPPNDSVSRMAQQQHQSIFRASTGWHDGTPSPALPRREAKITRRDWVDLPAFFQEDNVRQHWQVLTWFVENGYSWAPVAVSDPDPIRSDQWAEHLRRAAEAEYERWRSMRQRRGWWTGERTDSGRVNPELDGWHDASQDFTVQQVQRIIDRFWATGLAPVVKSQG